MGASKTQQYSDIELKRALIARAFAHPARIRIYEILKEKKSSRNIELTKSLGLTKSAVHAHIQKMLQAEIIELEYFRNDYFLQLSKDHLAVVDY